MFFVLFRHSINIMSQTTVKQLGFAYTFMSVLYEIKRKGPLCQCEIVFLKGLCRCIKMCIHNNIYKTFHKSEYITPSMHLVKLRKYNFLCEFYKRNVVLSSGVNACVAQAFIK